MEDKNIIKKPHRIICLGDTHGRPNWKKIVEKESSADLIIFIGDYFDSRNGGYHGKKQISNFLEILDYKKENSDKVILLTGNHDYHYIRGITETYSGYQHGFAIQIGEIVTKAIKDGYLKICYQYNNYFFSHAGLTKTWCGEILGNDNPTLNDVTIQVINDFLIFQPRVFGFNIGPNYSNTGDDVTQGPIWVRPHSLLTDMVDGVTCVVGHTTVYKLEINPKIILVDCLGTSGEYLIIEDNIAKSSE